MNIALKCEKCQSESGSLTVCHMVVHSDIFTQDKDFKYCPVDLEMAEWKEIKE